MEQSDTPPRELTLDEAVALAILLQKNEQLVEAQELYRRVLATAPESSSRAALCGRARASAGHSDEADRADRAKPCARAGSGGLAQQPGHHFAIDGQAGGGDRRLSACDRDRPGSRQRAQQSRRAVASDRQAARSGSRISHGHSTRSRITSTRTPTSGILLNGLKRTEEAAACYCKVITLRPKHREARRLLALAHCMLGEVGEAVKIFDEWLDEEPGDPIARHMLAACTGRDVPARASNGFVERTFDSFAASFESKLEQLVVPRAGARGGDAGGFGLEPVEAARCAGCRLRHRTLRSVVGPVCAPTGRRRSLRGHAGAGEGEARLRRADTRRVDGLSARPPRRVRRDRVSRHARVFRRSGIASSPPPPARCARTGCSSSRSSMPSAPWRMSTGDWSCTAAIVTPAPTWSGCSPPPDCSRGSPPPTCGWSQAHR